MNIFHYIDVIIGFSLAMLLLSIVTGFAAQACLSFVKSKARAVGTALSDLLCEIGLDADTARGSVDKLFDKKSAIFGKMVGAPKDIGREDFLLLLLRKAVAENKAFNSASAKAKDDVSYPAADNPNGNKASDQACPVESTDTDSALPGENDTLPPADAEDSRAEDKAVADGKAIDSALSGKNDTLPPTDAKGSHSEEKGVSDDTLPEFLERYLDLGPDGSIEGKLTELEEEILLEESKNPALPSQLWRTKAMQKVVPKLAARIFARFDDVMDRATEEVSGFGKLLGFIITLPVLLMVWPVDAIDLINRLSSDQALSKAVADIAEAKIPGIAAARTALDSCKKRIEGSGVAPNCTSEGANLESLAKEGLSEVGKLNGLFGDLKSYFTSDCGVLTSFFPDCKVARLTPGIIVSWILVGFGSAFWLGVLNKFLGIRSELSKKLETQRDYRSSSQILPPQS